MTVTVEPAQAWHIAPIARDMRAWDVRECAAFGASPVRALKTGLAGSHMVWTALVNERPVAMLGVAAVSLIDGIGHPWMLGTEEVYRQGRTMMRLYPVYFGQMKARFPRMENHVHRDNDKARRLIRRLGFQFEPEAHTVGGEPMVRFFLEP
jgi:ribosomal protein S18 acetylase RimI-like enzyme